MKYSFLAFDSFILLCNQVTEANHPHLHSLDSLLVRFERLHTKRWLRVFPFPLQLPEKYFCFFRAVVHIFAGRPVNRKILNVTGRIIRLSGLTTTLVLFAMLGLRTPGDNPTEVAKDKRPALFGAGRFFWHPDQTSLTTACNGGYTSLDTGKNSLLPATNVATANFSGIDLSMLMHLGGGVAGFHQLTPATVS